MAHSDLLSHDFMDNNNIPPPPLAQQHSADFIGYGRVSSL